MKTLLDSIKDSMIVKVLIAIIMFFFTWISNTQIEKNSEFYKSIKGDKNVFTENSSKLEQPKNINEILSKNSKQFYAKK
ncbi:MULTISPECIES: hypothetical protein [Polaribacter]|uniref:Uncharacterized protein n=1 Tax=Polaribacter marinaquae TaxID=1642819 RepID=A0ABZ2TRC4_9FLAO